MTTPLSINPAAAKRLRRSQIPAGESLCEHCSAKCCRYFALPIDAPKKRKDFDYIRWYLLHDRASVFVEDQNWYLLVHTTCKHLQDDHRCGIYETRPQICRDYTTDECEFDDDWCYEQYFETAEQIDEYAEALLGPPASASNHSQRDLLQEKTGRETLRSRRPSLLPVLPNPSSA